MINAGKVEENRKWMIKFALDNNTFNLYAYAQMFEVKTCVINKDIEELYGKDYQYENNPDIKTATMVGFRDLQLKSMETSMGKEDALAMMGMWHEPVKTETLSALFPRFAENAVIYGKTNELRSIGARYMEHPEEIEQLKDRLNAVSPHIEENIISLQRGLSKADVQRQFNLTNSEKTRLGEIAQMCGLEKTAERQLLKSEVAYSYAQEIAKGSRNLNKTAEIIGINHDTLRQLKGGGLESKKENNRIKERQEYAFQLYHEYGTTDGRTFSEIANEMGLSRATVENYVRAYKRENPDKVDETQLYRPRHAGLKKCMLKQERRQAVLDEYRRTNAGESMTQTEFINHLRQKTGTTQDFVYATLREAGILEVFPKNSRTSMDKTEHYAHTAFKEKGQFGAGSTRTLLNEQGISATTGREVHNARGKILHSQRKSMIEIRRREENRAAFNQKGSLQDVLKLCEERDNSPIRRIQEEREETIAVER